MPAKARTSTEAVVAAGRAIIERDGLAALTMLAVAEAVGVKGASLYKRVPSRAALVTMIAEQVTLELVDEVESAIGSGDPAHELRAFADAFRSFAHRNPGTYPLLFDPDQGAVSPEVRERSAAAVRRVAAALAGPEHELSAARLLTAWAHGFVSMELASAFQLGGDVDQAWEFALDRLAAALVVTARPVAGRVSRTRTGRT
ncbi:WHG domain-containing protein [Nocardioides agariphilus]|jgi:AcrR family transcriptional regulator|uniref:WHG domain-containing protein n=1 Tax=Nocardioides agariphilus TaxID=433664 RepID=A0A930YM66_9ACTN|nr:TetR-like C-terminal domain-containing protein [Nocardioides agariphilus]MBF4767789.1 WHG domain-containing protein [Nocardioides agariphilus]